MTNGRILWADDEMELLRPHLLFLERKGYDVVTATNGTDAVELCQQQQFDVILLDEMMPGITGLQALERIKLIQPTVPVVMVTKSEEENIMNEAVGRNIADYLIKPVNPNQILLSLKKLIHRKELVAETTQTAYQQHFQQLSMQMMDCCCWNDWAALYRQLVDWELKLVSADPALADMLRMQKAEANLGFAKFVKRNYADWMQHHDFTMNHDVMQHHILPMLKQGEKVFLVVFDNFRYDQWKAIETELTDYDITEQLCCSILPTVTQYARNALFAGLMPSEIKQRYPDWWTEEDAEESKNLNEPHLIQAFLDRVRRRDTFSYHKINTTDEAEQLLAEADELLQRNSLNVVVVNFIDMLSHARTESKMVRELAHDEAAYRSLTLSWFRHSAISQLLHRLSQTDCRVVLTTDHGSIRTDTPVKIIGDRNTNTNLRYKLGRNLACESRDVFTVKDPKSVFLPSPNISTSYVFATGNTFLAYPNNYNYYVAYYRNTFQHGGISMEEMIIPLVTLKGKNR
ncbi:bifunctional response regulator/alkaline phosphatase family protein [Prevotella brevis]|uniref:Bifunctional response regulator/alkaline phosphatase family protein n=1 Tax=Xylanibacter brevis TaxID=83231 RepID=A0ABS9CH87_9BACT|nr:bifunctional response regulator/alkaline phosphatase family protein [Xylanibacter brevis]MCF2563301.1 bifunctional response regulator/alkaline phosphatase family protein [Xylanibacter brevis]